MKIVIIGSLCLQRNGNGLGKEDDKRRTIVLNCKDDCKRNFFSKTLVSVLQRMTPLQPRKVEEVEFFSQKVFLKLNF